MQKHKDNYKTDFNVCIAAKLKIKATLPRVAFFIKRKKRMVEKINGGYILLARNIIESQIWQKPAEYLKIWIYILCRVQWKQSKKTKIGENFFNFSKEKIPGVTRFQMYEFLRWAKTLNPTDSTTQITTEKTTRGTWLKVTKYAYYQDVKNYVHQNTYQQLHQQIPNTISKTLNKREIINNLSLEEREILKKYLLELNEKRKNKIEDIDAYIRKLVENGDYLTKLEKAKKKLERQKAKENIPPPEKIEEPEGERMSIEDVRALVKEKMKRRDK